MKRLRDSNERHGVLTLWQFLSMKQLKIASFCPSYFWKYHLCAFTHVTPLRGDAELLIEINNT